MKIIVNGAGGHMGAEVIKAAAAYPGAEVVFEADAVSAEFSPLNTFSGDADVIIDFSHHAGTSALIEYAVSRAVPTVIATTAQTEDELQIIHGASEKIPVFMSANMSVGVALLVRLARLSAAVFPDADIEIVETHHNRKLDAPSGTALMLADAIREVRPDAKYVAGRNGRSVREKNEIGISSIRCGNVVGDHEVIIATENQTITLKHQAHTRAVFAEGALAAAEFLVKQTAGLYSITDMLKE